MYDFGGKERYVKRFFCLKYVDLLHSVVDNNEDNLYVMVLSSNSNRKLELPRTLV
jgi:hypothetical protein